MQLGKIFVSRRKAGDLIVALAVAILSLFSPIKVEMHLFERACPSALLDNFSLKTNSG